jgi:hypothetical protein
VSIKPHLLLQGGATAEHLKNELCNFQRGKIKLNILAVSPFKEKNGND